MAAKIIVLKRESKVVSVTNPDISIQQVPLEVWSTFQHRQYAVTSWYHQNVQIGGAAELTMPARSGTSQSGRQYSGPVSYWPPSFGPFPGARCPPEQLTQALPQRDSAHWWPLNGKSTTLLYRSHPAH